MVVGTLPLLLKAAREPDHLHVVAMAVFMLSMILLYLASTVYHTFDVNGKVNRRLKKFDHMMISVLIGKLYADLSGALHGRTGIVLCALVWAAAIGGILVKAFWINCPRWFFSSVLYIAMGWLCVLAFHPLFSGSFTAGIWMVAGGRHHLYGRRGDLLIKMPMFNAKHKSSGTHEIFHLFVMGGSFCHLL